MNNKIIEDRKNVDTSEEVIMSELNTPRKIELENIVELEEAEENRFERDIYLAELCDRLCQGQSLQTAY